MILLDFLLRKQNQGKQCVLYQKIQGAAQLMGINVNSTISLPLQQVLLLVLLEVFCTVLLILN